MLNNDTDGKIQNLFSKPQLTNNNVNPVVSKMRIVIRIECPIEKLIIICSVEILCFTTFEIVGYI